MYLKQIEIYGFKSFGSKAVIKFDNKVTGIVGPNGSGKSNIVDAVRWVLGEQRVKSLRGGKMQDVIFSGSEERKALGYAFVNITIDNSTGILPSDYEEVNVSRRLYRSGESEYYINKKAVRLRDVQELFMDTGLSREGYSIISQGKIESIVNNSAADRKLMIEEAVGIVKYKSRKKEATRKLERTQNNLVRLRDIVGELEKRLPSLKRSSRKAIKYLDYFNELKGQELNLFVHRADEYRADLEKTVSDRAVMQENMMQFERDIEILDTNYTELRELISGYDEKINSANEELHDFISTYENSKVEIEVNRNTIQMLKESITELEASQNELAEENRNYISSIEEMKESISQKEYEVKTIEEKIAVIDKEVKRLKRISDETEDAISRENVSLRTKERTLENRRNFLNESLTRMENNSFIRKTRIEEIAELEKRAEELEKADGYADLSGLEEKYEKLDDENNALLEKRYRIEEERADYRDGVLKMYNDIKLLKNQRDLLKGYEENKEGYRFGVKKLFERKQSDSSLESGVYGTVGDLIKVEPKYMEAVQKALGATIEHVVVKDERTAARAISLLKKNRWGRVTFLPSNIIRERRINGIENITKNARGYEGLGCDFVKYDRKYENIIRNALANVLVFDTLDHANAFAADTSHRYKIVTLDGEVLFPGGAMVGGRNRNDDRSLLSRKNQIEKLEKDIRKKIAEYNAEIKKSEEFDRRFTEIDALIKEKTDSLNDVTVKISRLEEKNRESEDALEDCYSQIEAKKAEIEKIEKANLKISEMNERDRTEIENLEREIGEKKKEIEDISKGLYKDRYLEVMEKNHEEEMKLVKEEETLRTMRVELSNLNEMRRKVVEESLSNARDINENHSQIEELKEKIEQAKGLDRDYESLRQGLDDRYQKLMDEKKKANEEFDRVDEKLKSLQEERYQLNDRINKLESREEKINIRMEHLQQGIMDDYNMTYAQAQEYRVEVDNMLEVEENVNELKGKIAKLGKNINLDSIEEYREVKERFEFLDGQKKDLEEAKENLLSVINDINTKMEEKFSTEFISINTEFNNVFSKLFNGGRAALELTDPENIMDSGIDIVVSLPKKKTKNISSLSGGEKSLTAIALILAILKLKPAPFCILDEIDAALDDANVARFCNYMKSIIEDNQFIIVTHRKITMGIADVLYGATMGSEGITRIVSVRLTDVREGGAIRNVN